MSKLKRYVATIEIYVYGKSEDEAIKEGWDRCTELDKKYDNKACLVSVKKQDFAKIG